MAITILRLASVKARTGLSGSTIYSHVRQGKFPAPVAVGPRAKGWVEAEVNEWLKAQIAKSRPADNSQHEHMSY